MEVPENEHVITVTLTYPRPWPHQTTHNRWVFYDRGNRRGRCAGGQLLLPRVIHLPYLEVFTFTVVEVPMTIDLKHHQDCELILALNNIRT